LRGRFVEVDMKHEGRRSQSPALASAVEASATETANQDPMQPSIKLTGTPPLAPDEYERVLQQVASDLFLNDEQFRKAVVLREVRKVVLGWGAAIGITSLFAIATLYMNARDSLKQTVSTELSKAVREHVSARSEFLNESVKSLTSTAVGQIVDVQKELESAQTALDRAEKQLAVANQQSGDLQRRIASISDTLSSCSKMRSGSGTCRTPSAWPALFARSRMRKMARQWATCCTESIGWRRSRSRAKS
jgi:hypothetical protein